MESEMGRQAAVHQMKQFLFGKEAAADAAEHL
jgi:hypothetical protein